MKRTPENEAIAKIQDARHFNEMMTNNRFRQREYRRLANEVVEMGVPPGGKVLDIGTGPGFVAIAVSQLLAENGCKIVGLDLSPAMLTLAAENARQKGLNGLLTWREGDAKAMPFEDNEFDFVVCNDSLHHWEDPLPVFDEIARVLKDDGQCIIQDSKRLQQWPPRLIVWTVEAIGLVSVFFTWIVGRNRSPDFRTHWWNSIKSSYTPDELQCILERSRLQGWRVEEDFMQVTVVKEKPTCHS
jgi:ubiquinone/menaquinone biosynthesis C-methylase UbiE